MDRVEMRPNGGTMHSSATDEQGNQADEDNEEDTIEFNQNFNNLIQIIPFSRTDRIPQIEDEPKMGLGNTNYDLDEESISLAAREWEDVTTVELTYSCHSLQNLEAERKPQRISPPLSLMIEATQTCQRVEVCSLQEINSYFLSNDLSAYFSRINREPRDGKLARKLLRFMCIGYPKVKKPLREVRDRIFAIAMKPFDNGDDFHFRLLATIREHLTEEPSIGISRYGSHWTEIGFQGSDPATDLRGMGMLGLINLAYFVVNLETRHRAKEIYRLSIDLEQNFPFCAMGINLSQMSLQTLRSGQLNQYINDEKDPFKVFNRLYSSIFWQLYEVWVRGGKTVVDSGFVINDLRQMLRKDAGTFYRVNEPTVGTKTEFVRYGKRIDDRNAGHKENRLDDRIVGDEITFTDIGGIFD